MPVPELSVLEASEMSQTIIDFDRLERESDCFREIWQSASPFELLVIDGFGNSERMSNIHQNFPDISVLKKSRDYIFAKEKYEKNNFSSLSVDLNDLHSEINSERFKIFLQKVTGIKLFIDPDFHGGGLHSGGIGSYLDMHADFNVHPLHSNWVRELNILIYLNEGWHSGWGGQLKLRHSITGLSREVEPLFNRCVVMLTKEHTLHGYDPIAFPPGRYRRSIAAYAYSEALEGDAPDARSTNWVSDQSIIRRALGPVTLQLVQLKNKIFGSGSTHNR
jgi:Rps23 Pro-64 3,4-dihydroxylase Tpa1-like proline 4-hydroxylase